MIAELMRLFAGLPRAHGVTELKATVSAKGKRAASSYTVLEPVTAEKWEAHLAGKRGLGIIPIRDDSTVAWGCIDVDRYKDFDLIDVAKRAAEYPLVLCRSKSGGAHLFLFLRDATSAAKVRDLLADWATRLGFPGSEVYPKQVSLASSNDVGNWLNMPYFGGDQTDRYCIDAYGQRLGVQQFIAIARERAVDPAALASIVPPPDEVPYGDGPPCLQYIAAHKLEEGGRNDALFAFGVYWRRADGDNWEKRVDEVNHDLFLPPLGAKEVQTVTKSLHRKDYAYPCKKEPMATHCNRTLCKQRQFGIGGEDVAVDPGVMIDSLAKIDSTPPLWIITVDGHRMQVTTEQLQSQMLFHRLCLERISKWPAPVKPARWRGLINGLLANVEVLEAPEDASTSGQLMIHLEAFCTGKAQARERDELLLGKPWKDDDGRTYFQSEALLKYLDQQRAGMKAHELYAQLRMTRDVKHHGLNLKGKFLNVWSVPSFPEQVEGHAAARVAEVPEENF